MVGRLLPVRSRAKDRDPPRAPNAGHELVTPSFAGELCMQETSTSAVVQNPSTKVEAIIRAERIEK